MADIFSVINLKWGNFGLGVDGYYCDFEYPHRRYVAYAVNEEWYVLRQDYDGKEFHESTVFMGVFGSDNVLSELKNIIFNDLECLS